MPMIENIPGHQCATCTPLNTTQQKVFVKQCVQRLKLDLSNHPQDMNAMKNFVSIFSQQKSITLCEAKISQIANELWKAEIHKGK